MFLLCLVLVHLVAPFSFTQLFNCLINNSRCKHNMDRIEAIFLLLIAVMFTEIFVNDLICITSCLVYHCDPGRITGS